MVLFISLVLIGFALFYYYRKRRQNVFLKEGIKGPPPNFLFGNLIEYRKTPYHELIVKWDKEYGKIFTYFEGPTPNLVIGDPDLLQEIMIKQFSNFHGRKLFAMQQNPDKEEKVSMFIARGKRWKRLRTAINPAFSDSKMRRMFPMVDECINCFISKIDQQVSEKDVGVDIQEFLQRLTMDVICQCAFGIDTNCQTNVTHPFIVCLKRFLGSFTFSNLKAVICMTLPELKPLFVYLFERMKKKPAQNTELMTIRAKLLQVIEARQKSPEKRYDLLQLLLDSEQSGAKILDEDNLCPMNDNTTLSKGDNQTDEEKIEDSANKARTNIKPLTTEEVIAQANLFLFAGYETSSTALSYAMHLLALHPDVQERLQREIDDAFEMTQSKDFESLELYDILGKLTYLNAVVYEVLRYYPFTSPVVTRLCMKSGGTYLSNGMFIPDGTNIIPNILAIHFDSEIWTTIDPQKFAPERFLQKKDNEEEFIGPPHPLAWLPFGAGPRNCIGQRFATMVVKATLVRFIRHYEVKKSSKTENPLKLKMGAVISPKNGIHIAISKRNH